MFKQNRSNEAHVAEEIWQAASSPRISILKQLADKLLSEVESINNSERIYFGEGFKLYDQVQNFEINMIRHALSLANGKQCEAAQLLGIKTTTLNAKIKRYRLE